MIRPAPGRCPRPHAPSHTTFTAQVLDILAKLHSHTPSPRVLNTTKIHIYIQSKLAGMEGDIGRDAKGYYV